MARYQLITLTPCPQPEPTEVPDDVVDTPADDVDNSGNGDNSDDLDNQGDDGDQTGEVDNADDLNSDEGSDNSDEVDANDDLNKDVDGVEKPEANVTKSNNVKSQERETTELTTVAPVVPAILDVCVDGVPELDYDPSGGIEYHLQGPSENGEFALMAVLQDGFAWEDGIADWTVTDSVATFNELIVDVPDCARMDVASRSMSLTSDGTAEYGITKGRSPNAVVKGDQVTYTIRVDWGETSNAASFYVTDVIPSPLSYVTSECTSSGPGIIDCFASGSAPSLRWDVNPNGTVSGFVIITLVTQLPPDVWGIQVTNSAFVNDPALDIIASNTFTILEKDPPSIPVLPPDVPWHDSVCVGNEEQFPTFTPPVTGGGISYTIIGTVGYGKTIIVYANIGDGYLWDHESDDWPAGWEFNNQPDPTTSPVTPGVAVFTITFGPKVKCEQTPSAPKPLTPSVCVAGVVSEPTVSKPQNSTHIEYGNPVITGPSNGKFTITMTATLKGEDHDGWSSNPANWPGDGTWTISGNTATYTHKVDAGKCEKAEVPKPTFKIASCPDGVLGSSFFYLSSYEGVTVSITNNGSPVTLVSDGSGGWQLELGGSVAHEIQITLTLKNNGNGWQWPSDMHGFAANGKTATQTITVAKSDCEVSKVPTFNADRAVCEAGEITNHIFEYSGGEGVDIGYITAPSVTPTENNGTWVFERDGQEDFEVTITLTLKTDYYWPSGISLANGWKVTGKTAERTWGFNATNCTPTTPVEIDPGDSVCKDGVVKPPPAELPGNANGISYSNLSVTNNGNGTWKVTMTATLQSNSNYMWSDLSGWPEGWTQKDATTALYELDVDAGDCTPTDPLLIDPTPGVCEDGTWTAPQFNLQDTKVVGETAIKYVLTSGPDANGNYTITATWQDGFSQPNGFPTQDQKDDGWAKVNAYKATYKSEVDMNTCDQPSIRKIEIELSQCVQGDAQPHTLTIPTMEGMTVTSITGATTGMNPVAVGFGDFTFPASNAGQVVVTFTIADDYEWPASFPNHEDGTWAKKDKTKATFTFKLKANSCEEDVVISKSPASQTAGIGDTVSFEITVTNNGDGDATGVSFEDEIDTDLWNIGGWSFSPADANCEFTGNVFSCSDIDLDADGGEFTVTITSGTIDADNIPMCGPYSNEAELTGDREGASNNVKVKIECEPDVEITKTAGNSPVQPGQDVTFTMVVTNTGNVDLPGNGYSSAKVEDTLSSALVWSITPAVDGCEIVGQAGNGTGGTLECELALASEASSAAIIVTASTTDGNPECGEIPNTAYVNVYKYGNQDAAASDDDNASVTITCVEDWTVEKDSEITTDVDPQGPSVGDTITYTITITNTGNSDLNGLQLTDVFSGENDLNWVDFDYGTDTIDIPYGDSADITATYVVTQEDFDLKQIENCAYVSGVPSGPGEENCVIDPFDHDPGVDAEKNLLTELQDPVKAGTVINYEIVVTNTGDTSQTEIQVQENLLSGDPAFLDVQVANATGTNGATNISATFEAGTITITGDILPGGVVTIPVQYTIQQADIDAGEIENCVVLEGDTDPSNNCDGREDLDKPSVELTKIATDDAYTVVLGEDGYISYTIEVTNTGNVTITEATITDELLSLPSVPAGAAWEVFLADGGSLTPIALENNAYTLTTPILPDESVSLVVRAALPTDVELPETTEVEWCGPWPNSVLLNGEYGNGDSIDETAQTTVQVNCTGLDIQKTSSTAGQILVPGDSVEYQIVVSNDGNMPVMNVTVTDSDLANAPLENIVAMSPDGMCEFNASGAECYFGFIPAGGGATITITANVLPVGEISWEQCEAGLSNTAKVQKNFSNMMPMRGITLPGVSDIVSAPAVVHDITCQPGISIDKSELAQDPTIVAPVDRMDPGDTVTFAFEVKNTGQVDLFNVELTDDHDVVWVDGDGKAVENGNIIPQMDSGETVTLYARYTLTQGNLDMGSILNCVDVIGYVTVTGGESVEDDDCEPVRYPQVPDIELEKTGSEIVAPAGELTYTLTLTNTGNVTALVVNLTDSMPEGSSNWTITSQSGFTFCGFLAEGQLTCLGMMIPAGGTATVTITGAAPIQPDVEQCQAGLINDANVTSGTVAGSANDDATWPTAYDCEPVLEIEKTVADASVAPGETLEFSITVTNTGTYPATDLSLLDDLSLAGVDGLDWTDDSDVCEIVAGVLSCEIDELPAYTGNEFTVTFSAEVQVEEPVCGPYTNTVTLGGDDAQYAEESVAAVDFAIDCAPNYEVEKTSSMMIDADEDGDLSLGDTIEYTITVTNTGNQHLSGIVLDDQFSGAGEGGLTWTAPDGFDGENVPTVNVGNSLDLVATYVITQDDVDAGEIENCAFMTYQVDEETVIERDDCADDDIEQNPDYEVEKTSSMMIDADEDGDLSLGDTLEYTITVTNTGNLTLNGITLDDQFTGAGEGGLTWTAPEGFDGENVPTVNVGSSIDLVATYVVTQGDVDAGEIENCAFMTYQVDEETVIERDDCADDDLDQDPVFTVEKTSANTDDADDNGALSVGDTITYTITVTNTGNLTLNGITLDDQFTGAGEGGLTWTAPAGFDGVNVPTVNVGSSIDLVATYVITQDDVDEGAIQNCALMTYQVDEETGIIREDCEDDDIRQNPGVQIEKTSTSSANPELLRVDNVVTYTFTVTNIGNVTLTNIDITDRMEDVEFVDGVSSIESIAPGESAALTATYIVTQEDVDDGMIVNCADVDALTPAGDSVDNGDCDTRFTEQVLSGNLLSTADCPGPVENFVPNTGQVITFEVTVENTGTVTAYNVTVTASREGTFNSPFSSTFAPGQSETREYYILATQADVDAGTVSVDFHVEADGTVGASTMLASMAAMQDAGQQVEGTLTFDCVPPMKPQPETPLKPGTPPVGETVAQLPNTGHGSVASTASLLWAAAMLSVLALGTTAVGIRRKYRS